MFALVKRQRELNKLVGLWERICQGDSSKTFCEFYGVPGIGKTELSKQIQTTLKNEGAMCARLDFDPIQNPWGSEPKNEKVLSYYSKPIELFKDILVEWNYLSSLTFRDELSQGASEDTFEPQQFARQVVEEVKSLPSNKTVVLICDETDHIQWEWFSWFEMDLIVPLVMSGRCLIIWLGRRKKQWSAEATAGLSQVKTKIEDSSILEAFALDDIAEQVQIGKLNLAEENKQSLLNRLYEITHGFPMAVEVVMEHHSWNNLKEGKFEEDSEVVKDIVERVIKGYILRDNPLRFEEVLKLSLLRINDVSLLRSLVGNPNDSVLSYGRLSNELRANPLSDFPNRLLKQSIASWLQRYFRIIDPNEFLTKQDTLHQECTRLCNLTGENNWSKFVIESIFHAACANMVTKKYDYAKILKSHLCNLQLTEITGDSESLITKLEESIKKDKELEEYIGRDDIDQLLFILGNEKELLLPKR